MIAQSLWKILLVDDDEDDYIITKIMLSEMQGRKAQLVWVSSFEEGRQALANWSYDAVLMDYDLGLGTGLELIREAVANNYPAPLILLTGRGNYEVDVEAMQAGATLYLTKSEVNPLLLERSIRYAIERKRIEQERKQILESIQDGFFAIDKDWQILYINSRAARAAGYEPEELIGRNFWEVFPRVAGTPYEQIYRSAMQERKTVKFEMKGIYQGIWYTINIYPFQEGISVYSQDITERKRAEDALRESEQRFRTIFERAEIGIAIGDIHGRVIQSNAALERMIGYSKEELHGKAFTEFTHPDDVLIELSLLEEMLAGQRDHYEIEKRYLRKDGQEILVRLIRSQVCNEQGEPQLGVALIEDITERKRMDRALRAEKATLAGILNATKESIWLFDRNGIIRMANDTALDRVNLPAEEIIGRHFNQLMSPELAASRLMRLNEAIETKLPVMFEDERAGFIFHHSFYPIFGDQGEVTGVVSFSRDITGQKHTEQVLQQRSQELEVSQVQAENARRRLEAVMAALPVGVAITDASGGNIQANPAFEQVWGGPVQPAQSVEDYTVYQAWWADTGKPVQPEEWASAQAVLKGETVHGQILQIQRFDGRRVFVLNSASPIIDANGAIIGSAVAIQDINRVKQSETLAKALNRINQLLYSTMDFEEVMQLALVAACEALGGESSAISIRKNGSWVVSYVHGFPKEVIGMQMVDDEERHAVLAIQTRRPVAIHDAFEDQRVNREHMRKWGIRSVFVVPILLRQEVIGVIFFNYQTRCFDFQEEHILFGTNLAASLSLALENARLFTNLQEEMREREKAEVELINKSEALTESNAALRQSEQRWATTLASIGDGVIATDINGLITFMNSSAEGLTGWCWKESTGRRLGDVFHIVNESTRERAHNPVEKVVEQGLVIGLANHTLLIRKDGTEIAIEDSGAPIRDENGAITGVVLVFRKGA